MDLLHVTDMSWGRLQNPNELFRVGDNIQVKVLKFDRDRERVSLGYKQLLPDPWSSVEERFPVGTRVNGRVASVADYGAFVELEAGCRRTRSRFRDELVKARQAPEQSG